MLLRAAFPVIFELAHDDVLGRRNGEHLAFHFQLPRPRQSPGVQWISPTQIHVRIETGLMVNDVEVSALFAGYFHRDHLCRRTIELCWREYLGQPGNVPAIQHHDQIYIMGQARLTINDDRHAPADHVGHAQRVQPLCEHEKEVSLGHTRKSGERPDGWLRRSNRGVGRARQPPLVAGRNETAVRPPAIFAPATLFAPRFALRFSWLCTSLYSGPCVDKAFEELLRGPGRSGEFLRGGHFFAEPALGALERRLETTAADGPTGPGRLPCKIG